MPAETFISLSGLTKRYGQRVILDDISCEIQAGQTVALIGPSGGGKSTLLRCLNGLAVPEEGQIRVGPHSWSPANQGPPRDVRRLLGMVFQDFQLFPHLTALQNVVEAPRRVLGQPRDAAHAKAMELLQRVGLEQRADFYPSQLSGGQKQRVAIARALAMQPRGILCDEITSALDPELKHEVLEVLEDLRAEGLTLLVVTHEMGFARRAADRVLVLAEGLIIEDGPPQQVFDAPRTERTQRFLHSVMA